jgi:hypothetical protein
MAVYAEACILFALLTKELSQRQLTAHGGGRGTCIFHVVGRSGCRLEGLAARSCSVGVFHQLCSGLDAAVGGRGRRRVGEDPDAKDVFAVHDNIWIRYFHLFIVGELLVEAVQASSVVDDDTVAVGADGRRGQLADEESTLNTELLPLLSLEFVGIQYCIRGDVLNRDEVGVHATEDFEVELLVGPRGWAGHFDSGRRIGLVVRCLGRWWLVCAGFPIRRHVVL